MLTYELSTGATGYIGGDALHALYTAHPEYEYAILVRNSDKGAAVAAEYPKVRLVYGGLDDSELLEEEASKADIVLRIDILILKQNEIKLMLYRHCRFFRSLGRSKSYCSWSRKGTQCGEPWLLDPCIWNW